MITFWNLQLLADGGAAGDGGGASATGVAPGGGAADAALTDRLAAMGVPQDKIDKNRKALERREKAAMRRQPETKAQQAAPEKTPEEPQAAEVEAPAAEAPAQTDAPAKLTLEQLLADPDYKKILGDYANGIVRDRVKNTGKEAEAYRQIQPALEVLAPYYGMDAKNLDVAALVRKVVEDDNYYEDRALQSGETVEEIRKRDQQARQQRDFVEQNMRAHFDGLRQQEAALKAQYPDFDLGRELQNKKFAQLVAPGSLMSLEDAYYAVHRQEIMAAQQQAAQAAAMQAASQSIQAGKARPQENGTVSRGVAPASTAMTREQRESLKRRIYAAAARGEKIYPT